MVNFIIKNGCSLSKFTAYPCPIIYINSKLLFKVYCCPSTYLVCNTITKSKTLCDINHGYCMCDQLPRCCCTHLDARFSIRTNVRRDTSIFTSKTFLLFCFSFFCKLMKGFCFLAPSLKVQG